MDLNSVYQVLNELKTKYDLVENDLLSLKSGLQRVKVDRKVIGKTLSKLINELKKSKSHHYYIKFKDWCGRNKKDFVKNFLAAISGVAGALSVYLLS